MISFLVKYSRPIPISAFLLKYINDIFKEKGFLKKHNSGEENISLRTGESIRSDISLRTRERYRNGEINWNNWRNRKEFTKQGINEYIRKK